MARKLRAVSPGEAASVAPPETLAEAAVVSRRAYLVMQRKVIDDAITAGVPAHALARLVATAGEIDAEIRRIDAQESQEVDQSGDVSDDAPFDAEAL